MATPVSLSIRQSQAMDRIQTSLDEVGLSTVPTISKKNRLKPTFLAEFLENLEKAFSETIRELTDSCHRFEDENKALKTLVDDLTKTIASLQDDK
jgi:hypothetical protein